MNLCAKKVDVPLELRSKLLKKMQEELEKGPPTSGLMGESPWQKSATLKADGALGRCREKLQLLGLGFYGAVGGPQELYDSMAVLRLNGYNGSTQSDSRRSSTFQAPSCS